MTEPVPKTSIKIVLGAMTIGKAGECLASFSEARIESQIGAEQARIHTLEEAGE